MLARAVPFTCPKCRFVAMDRYDYNDDDDDNNDDDDDDDDGDYDARVHAGKLSQLSLSCRVSETSHPMVVQ